MSIERQYDQIVIGCDTCETFFEGDSTDWDDVWPAAREEGWKARQIGNDWLHFCPRCKADEP